MVAEVMCIFAFHTQLSCTELTWEGGGEGCACLACCSKQAGLVLTLVSVERRGAGLLV